MAPTCYWTWGHRKGEHRKGFLTLRLENNRLHSKVGPHTGLCWPKTPFLNSLIGTNVVQ